MPEDSTNASQAKIEVSVSTENHDVQSGVKKLNPILQEILQSVKAPSAAPGKVRPLRFGRLTFSQHLD